jgi:hypothetical protein
MRAVTKAQKDLKDGGVIKEASAREVTGIGLGAFVSAQRGNQDFINIELQTSTLEFSLSVKIILMPGDKKGIPFWEDKATSIGKALVEKINNKNYKLKE